MEIIINPPQAIFDSQIDAFFRMSYAYEANFHFTCELVSARKR